MTKLYNTHAVVKPRKVTNTTMMASTFLFTCLCLMMNNSHASRSHAMEVFDRAYDRCKQALSTSRVNLEQANKNIDVYHALTRRAQRIDPDFLTEAAVKQKMTACEKVTQSISRANALPIFQEAMNFCQRGFVQLRQEDHSQAKISSRRYQNMRDKAIAESHTILKVPNIVSEIGRCDRLDAKITRSERLMKDVEFELDRSVVSFTQMVNRCESTLTSIKGIDELSDQILTGMMSQQKAVDEFDSRARSYELAIQRVKQGSLHEFAVELRTLMQRADICKTNLYASISAYESDLIASRKATEEAVQEDTAIASIAPLESTPAVENGVMDDDELATLVSAAEASMAQEALAEPVQDAADLETFLMDASGSDFAVIPEGNPDNSL